MGKKKSKQSKAGSTERRAGKLPKGNMQFAVIREFNGGSRFTALCEDGKNTGQTKKTNVVSCKRPYTDKTLGGSVR